MIYFWECNYNRHDNLLLVFGFNDTCYASGKNSQNQQLLDTLTCNSPNIPDYGLLGKKFFVRFFKDGLLAEL